MRSFLVAQSLAAFAKFCGSKVNIRRRVRTSHPPPLFF